MTEITLKFREFAKGEMKTHGDQIRKWAKLDNPLLSHLCREVIEAAGEKP